MSEDREPPKHASPELAREPATRLVFGCLFSAYAAFLIVSLPSYGPTWDVFHEFPRATAYVSHLLGEKTPTGVSPWHLLDYDWARATHTGSLNGCLPSLVAALSGKIFYEKLEVLDYIDAYHLGLVGLWLLFIAHFHSRLRELHGPRLALLATVLLALSPRVVAHVPNNMKDIPAMAFATSALLELAVAVMLKRPRRIYWTALLVACAVSSKFVGGIVALPGALVVYLGLREGRLLPRIPLPYLIPLLCIPLATVAVLIGHWPYLWEPLPELWTRLVDLKAVVGQRVGATPNAYPFYMAAITTPLPILLGLACASLAVFRKPAATPFERILLLFYAFWIASVLAVFSSGQLALFDGIRHFILFVPPAAVLAAWGILRASEAAFERLGATKRNLARGHTAVILAVLLASALPIARYHPYEVTYFNALIGGLHGATGLDFGDDVDFDARDYWGTSVRASVEWANRNLPPDAVIFVSLPPHFATINPYRLRSDLTYSKPPRNPGLRPHYLVFVNREAWLGARERYAIANGQLLHQEEILGEPLSFVYRWLPR